MKHNPVAKYARRVNRHAAHRDRKKIRGEVRCVKHSRQGLIDSIKAYRFYKKFVGASGPFFGGEKSCSGF